MPYCFLVLKICIVCPLNISRCSLKTLLKSQEKHTYLDLGEILCSIDLQACSYIHPLLTDLVSICQGIVQYEH